MMNRGYKYYPRYVVLWFIKLYQRTLSFDHGPMKDYFPHGFCRYHPTCSVYGYDAIEKYGVIKGSAKAMWRIMRCNPFSGGGNDPLK